MLLQLQCHPLFDFMRCKSPRSGLLVYWCIDKYFHIFIIELLSSYDSESRKIHTKAVVDVSESGGMGKGGGDFGICSARGQMTLIGESLLWVNWG